MAGRSKSIGNLYATLGLNSTPFKKDIEVSRKELADFMARMKGGEGTISAFSGKLNAAGGAAVRYGEKLRKLAGEVPTNSIYGLTEALRKAEQQMKSAPLGSKLFQSAVTDVRRLTAELDNASANINSKLKSVGSGRMHFDLGTIDGLTAAISRAETKMRSLNTASFEFQSYSKYVGNLRGQLDAATGGINRFGNAGTAHMARLNMVSMDVSRVIQDMPYGLMGIGNNIVPLFESFGRLKQEVGSGKAAVMALTKAMAGPMGLIMGVSVVTSLAIAFGPKLMEAIKNASGAVDDLKDRLEGVQQYKNLEIELKIRGLSGLDKIEARLEAIMAQKAYLVDEVSYSMAVKQAAAAENKAAAAQGGRSAYERAVSPFTLQANQYEQALKALNAAKKAQSDFERRTAESIAAGRLDLGEKRNAQLLTSKLGMSADEAKALQEHIKLNQQQNEADQDKLNEQKKLAEKAEKESGRLSSATGRASKALRDAAAAQEETNDAITGAKEWYAKLTEEFPGLYDEIKKQEEAQYNLALLVNQGVISLDTFNAAVNNSADALETFKLNAAIAEEEKNRGGGSKLDAAKANERDALIADGISALGESLNNSGIKIAGFDQFSAAYRSLTNVNSQIASGEIASNSPEARLGQIQGYSMIAQGVGAAIGGDVGSAISNTASMAAAGATIGGPIGAVVGGVVGLVSSIFGGGSNYEEERAARDQARRQIYDNMLSSALSGGTESLRILQAGGWSYDQVKNLNETLLTPGGYYGMKADERPYRLFEDRGEEELAKLSQALQLLDNAGKTVSEYMTPSVLRDLESASVELEYALATVGDLASVTEAYYASIAMSLGVSADNVNSMVIEAFKTATSGEQAGRVFAENFEEQFAAGLQQMAIAQMVNDAIMPYLQPQMNALVSGLIDGTLTADQMASMMGSIQSMAANITPVVAELYGMLQDSGVQGYQYTGATYAPNPLTLEARASGGPVVAGRSYIVGEHRAELFTPRVSGTITPYVPESSGADSIMMERFLMEIKSVLAEGREVTVTIDGQQFGAWMERKRLKTESRIAGGMSRTISQVIG